MAKSTICADTGNGATFVATGGLSGWTGKVRRIEFSEVSVDRIDCSSLSTVTYRSTIANDLTDPPEITITYLHDTFDSLPVVGSSITTITVTFPLRTGETTAANWAGSGYVKSLQMPVLANGEIQEGRLVVAFDGVTGPTYTKST